MLVAAYMEKHPGSPQTIKQHLAAIKMLFDYLVISQREPDSPLFPAGPDVWAWSMAGSDRQHQEEDASARLHYLSERLYRCGSLLLIGVAN
jgi:hypothetical protein